MVTNETPSSADDPTSERQRILDFFAAEWPPEDPQTLYAWGWTRLPRLGKLLCLRAVLAAYEVRPFRQQETEYDQSARRAAERWVLNPGEETRKAAGRVASVALPQWSYARVIANMAGSRNRWPTAVGYGLTGNPANVDSDQFRAVCAAIEQEIVAWARGEQDPIAERNGAGRERVRLPGSAS